MATPPTTLSTRLAWCSSDGIERPKLAYSMDEAAEASSLGRSLLYDAIKAGDLSARKRGRRTYVLHDDLVKFLAAGAEIEV
jgi:hypothetical protein